MRAAGARGRPGPTRPGVPAIDHSGGSHLLRCPCILVTAVMPGIAPTYLPSRSVVAAGGAPGDLPSGAIRWVRVARHRLVLVTAGWFAPGPGGAVGLVR